MTFIKIIKHSVYFFFFVLFLNCLALDGQSPVSTRLSTDFPLNSLFSTGVSIYSEAYNAELNILAITVKNRIFIWNGYSTMEFICKGNAFIDICTSGKVYFATNSQLGFIEGILTGKPALHSLTEILPMNDIAEISGIVCLNDLLFFHSRNKITIYDGNSISTLLNSIYSFKLIKSGDNNLYIFNAEHGLQNVYPANPGVDSGLISFPSGSLVELILENKQERYVVTSQQDIYQINKDNKPKKFIHLPDEFKAPFTSGLLDDKKIVLGNSSQGILILDLKSKELLHLSKKNGLLDNSIKAIFLNPAGYYLSVHPNGICRIPDPSNLIAIDYATYIDARILGVFNTCTGLFLGSTNGLFELLENKQHFEKEYFTKSYSLIKIPGCESEIKSIFKTVSQNYFISKDGILLFSKGALSMFQSFNSVNCSYQPAMDSTLLVLGQEHGWTVLKYANHAFTILQNNSSSPYSIESISETSDRSIILKTGNNELIKLTRDFIEKPIIDESFTFLKSPVPGNQSQILYDGKHLMLLAPDSVFIFNEIKNAFTCLKYPPGPLNEILKLWPVTHDFNGNIWLQARSGLNNFGFGLFQLSLENNILNFKGWSGCEDCTTGIITDLASLSEDKVIYATNEKLVINNVSRAQTRKLKIIIKLSAKENQIIAEGSALTSDKITFSHQNNSFAATFYCDYPASERSVIFRYKLDGTSHALSSWNSGREVNFNSLSSGNYLLTVEAYSLNGLAYGQLKIPLRINIPLYLKWYMIIIYLLISFAGIIVYVRWKSFIFLKDKIKLESIVSQRTEELQNEKEKSELLLANILPKETADELKKKGKASSQKYEMVTVLFSDIQGFTKIAEQMNPEALIDQLDNFYFHFDSVVEKYNIEKIKTIGDAYMCAGGIPEKNKTNPVEVVLAALEVQDYMRELKKKNAEIWDVRIGIHTGPVIAGVIGHKKFSYDIWGDTVNTASRMESSGEASKINISGHTHELVKDFFICEYRGKMPVKYKGEIDMYFVKGIRPELSVDLYKIPNKNFFIHLQKLRLVDIEEFIFQTFETDVTSKLHFHNHRHTMEVYSLVELLGRAEGLTEEELLMARTAALMGDTGFLFDYNDNILKSVEFTRLNLPRFKYSEGQIQQVVHLLQKKDKVNLQSALIEKIMADAQTIYFGRVDFLNLAENLYQELNEMQVLSSKTDFIRGMEKTLLEHKFFTESAKRLHELAPGEQIQLLKKLA